MLIDAYRELRAGLDEIWPAWRFWVGLFILQGLIGVWAFEFSWGRTLRVRKGKKEMFDLFPTFRRYDTHMWSRAKFYPGCFTVFSLRAALLIGTFTVIVVINALCYVGEDTKYPVTGIRRTI